MEFKTIDELKARLAEISDETIAMNGLAFPPVFKESRVLGNLTEEGKRVSVLLRMAMRRFEEAKLRRSFDAPDPESELCKELIRQVAEASQLKETLRSLRHLIMRDLVGYDESSIAVFRGWVVATCPVESPGLMSALMQALRGGEDGELG